MTVYKNSFYNRHYQNSLPVITVRSEPEVYKGFLIYKRNGEFDIVINEVCIGMRAGINGAKRHIDYLSETLSKFPANQYVKPSNNDSNDYDVFTELFELGLVERKIENHYSGKILIGSTFYFKHNLQ